MNDDPSMDEFIKVKKIPSPYQVGYRDGYKKALESKNPDECIVCIDCEKAERYSGLSLVKIVCRKHTITRATGQATK